MKITKEMVLSARMITGGFSGRQVKIAQRIVGDRSWKKKITKIDVSDDQWKEFVSACPAHKRIGLGDHISEPKKKNRPKKCFYLSKEWRELRASVLERFGCKCMMCGRSAVTHGVVVHVDHIKPRSTHPNLELDIENLQVLCEDCNIGKSNKYTTDWRPKND